MGRLRKLAPLVPFLAFAIASQTLATDAAHADPAILAADHQSHDPSLVVPLDHPVDVVDYTIHAELDAPAHLVHGHETILWRNVSNAPVHEIWLHLYLNAFKNEDSLFLSEPVGHFRGGGKVQAWGAIDVTKFQLVKVATDDTAREDLWP